MALFGRQDPKGNDQPIVEIWGLKGRHNLDVVGESFHEKEIRAHLPRLGSSGSDEAVVPVTVFHDSTNVHDANAVAIRSSSGLLGYLSRDDATRYAPFLARIQTSGLTAGTTARIWGRIDEGWDNARPKFWGNVRIELPEPHMLVPVNEQPGGAGQMIPVGGAIQVTGEEAHMDALLPFVNKEGSCWVHVGLHPITEASSRAPKRVVEVRLNGAAVGQLSPKMSSDLLPAIDFLETRGETACVRAVVAGNQLKTEVTLYVQRSHEIPADWFERLDREPSRPTDHEPVRTVTQGQTPAPTPQLPPSDWYPDPHGIARLRFWDGQQWTAHTAE